MSSSYSYAYADESGDTGYQFDRGSSPRFVLGVIVPADPEATLDRIVALRRSLGKAATYEFHFTQADSQIRTSFLETIPQAADQLLFAVLHKQFAPADLRRLDKVGIYSYALAGLGLRTPFALSKCKLHLDGSGRQKAFLQTLKTNVRSICLAAGHHSRALKKFVCLSRPIR